MSARAKHCTEARLTVCTCAFRRTAKYFFLALFTVLALFAVFLWFLLCFWVYLRRFYRFFFIFFSIFQLYEYDEEYFIVSSLSRLARANQLNFMRFLSVSIQRTFLLARLILRGDFSLFLLFSTLLFSFLLGASLCLHRSFLPFHLKTL